MNEAHAEVVIAEQPHPQDLPSLDSQALAERIARLAAEVKAADIQVLRMRELVQYTDWFVIVSGRSDRQVAAIQAHVREALAADGVEPLSLEGTEQSQWVLVDYADVVLHVFYEPVREFYQLEKLWGQAPALEVAGLEDAGAAGG